MHCAECGVLARVVTRPRALFRVRFFYKVFYERGKQNDGVDGFCRYLSRLKVDIFYNSRNINHESSQVIRCSMVLTHLLSVFADRFFNFQVSSRAQSFGEIAQRTPRVGRRGGWINTVDHTIFVVAQGYRWGACESGVQRLHLVSDEMRLHRYAVPHASPLLLFLGLVRVWSSLFYVTNYE